MLGTALRWEETTMSEPGGTGLGATEAALWRTRQEEFVQQNLRRVFLVIYRIVGNVADAQDLTQEAFIKALQRQEQLKDLDKSAQWLSRIASNTAIDFLRRQGRVGFSEIDEVIQPLATPRESSPEALLLRSEQADYLEAGLSLLTDRERTALVLRDVEDLPAEEVARRLNCGKATVRSHIANARIKLRALPREVESRGQAMTASTPGALR